MEENNKAVKQIIVIRKDLNMRKGKMVAQACHASLGALLTMFEKNEYPDDRYKYSVTLNKWLNGIFTKICLYVNSEDELISLYDRIRQENSNIPCVMIEDSGLTEFHGIKTKTCIGIGPYWSHEIDKFTSNLPLL